MIKWFGIFLITILAILEPLPLWISEVFYSASILYSDYNF